MSIPMFITITKPNVPKYETITFICKDLDECHNKLIINIKKCIEKNVDYPEDLDNYSVLHHYNENNMDNDIFTYNIFHENEWITPWTNQDLYEQVIEIIHQVDIQNSIYNDKNYYDYCSDDDKKEIVTSV
jgi:CRISPR/Cas system CSM-associated protein Csm3 (group 7 of RAMP superfamily)